MTNAKDYLMVLDAGTGAGRCFLISTDGSETFDEYQEWAYEYPAQAQPGGAEFSAAHFWGIFSDLIRKTIHKAGIRPKQIKGISSTSQREGIVFLDADGKELYAGPNVDLRAPDDADAFTRQFGEKIHAISGHWPFPMFAPYRLFWFKQHQPQVFERIDSMLLLNDWILYRLCGQKASEPSNGNETALFNLFTNDWAWDLIDEMGLPKHIFPQIIPSGGLLGTIHQKTATETGLAVGTPVFMGGADTQCGLLGMGVIEPGNVGIALGTYGPIQMVVDKVVITEPALAWSGSHVVPDRWVLESTSMEAGQTFRWVRDTFYGNEDGDVYSLMEKEAAAAPIGANNIKAYLGPRLPNYSNLQFTGTGGFVTTLPPAPGTNTRADFARAALEGVGFGVRSNIDRLRKIAGRPIESLAACGGLSKSKTLIQTMANLLNVVVRVPTIKEGTAVGAAICAGVGSGIYSNAEEGTKALITWERECYPIPGEVQITSELYKAWWSRYPDMYGESTLKE